MGYIGKESLIFILIKLYELFQRILGKCKNYFNLNINRTTNIYVSHRYSTVLQTVFLRYLVVSSSKNFIFKRVLICGAVNAVSAANPLLIEKSSIFRTYILNPDWGSFSAWPLIPKAQDAMTSVVYLYIVSNTSTGKTLEKYAIIL